jgi:hypothetical protein
MPSISPLRNPDNDKTYTAGQQIFTENDSASEMYVVIDGEVDISFRGRHLETIGTGATSPAAPMPPPAPTAPSCRSIRNASSTWCSRRRTSPSR